MILTPAGEIHRRYKQQQQLLDWYEPMDYQQKAFRSTAKFQLFEGGNRSGKTECGAAKIVKICLGEHPTIKRPLPVKVRIVGTTLTEGAMDVILSKLRKFIPSTSLAGNSWEHAFNKEQRKIRFKNGSTIQLMADTQEIDNFRGSDLDVLWCDEEVREEVWDECVTRLADRNGFAILSMTPHRGLTWSYKRLVKKANIDPDIEYHYFDTLKNYYINRVEFIKSAALMPDREFQIRILGRRISLEGLVYSAFSQQVHLVGPFILPKGAQLFLGVDFGLNNPTAGCLVASFIDLSGKMKWFVVDEYYEVGKTVGQNAEAMGKWIKGKYKDYKLRFLTNDPNSGAQRSGQTNERNIDVFRKEFIKAYGSPVSVWNGFRGENVLEHRINKVNEYLIPAMGGEPKLKVFNTCLHTIDEFESYVYATRKNDDINKFERPKEFKNHLMNALEYVMEKDPRCLVTAKPVDTVQENYYHYDRIAR